MFPKSDKPSGQDARIPSAGRRHFRLFGNREIPIPAEPRHDQPLLVEIPNGDLSGLTQNLATRPDPIGELFA